MLTQRRNALALAAVLAVTTVTGGALVTVLSSPHSAARPSSINPAVVTLPQVAAPPARCSLRRGDERVARRRGGRELMHRILAATGAVWAVLAIALVIAVGHRTAAAAPPAATPTVIILRQVNGKLTTQAGRDTRRAASRQLASHQRGPGRSGLRRPRHDEDLVMDASTEQTFRAMGTTAASPPANAADAREPQRGDRRGARRDRTLRARALALRPGQRPLARQRRRPVDWVEVDADPARCPRRRAARSRGHGRALRPDDPARARRRPATTAASSSSSRERARPATARLARRRAASSSTPAPRVRAAEAARGRPRRHRQGLLARHARVDAMRGAWPGAARRARRPRRRHRRRRRAAGRRAVADRHRRPARAPAASSACSPCAAAASPPRAATAGASGPARPLHHLIDPATGAPAVAGPADRHRRRARPRPWPRHTRRRSRSCPSSGPAPTSRERPWLVGAARARTTGPSRARRSAARAARTVAVGVAA